MHVNKINEITNVSHASNNIKVHKKKTGQDVKGYVEKKAAPTDANLYKTVYGVKDKDLEEQAKYLEKLAEVRAKYEMDVDDKNREIANNKAAEQNPKKDDEEKSYYEQYLACKHKYE